MKKMVSVREREEEWRYSRCGGERHQLTVLAKGVSAWWLWHTGRYSRWEETGSKLKLKKRERERENP